MSPYRCSHFVKGAECRDGELYCNHRDIAPKNVDLYECSLDKYWRCQANECPCGDEIAYKGDYCINQAVFDYCQDKTTDACKYNNFDKICAQREFNKKGFGEFQSFVETQSHDEGCESHNFSFCMNPQGCYLQKKHFSFLSIAAHNSKSSFFTSEFYSHYDISDYHYDSFEDFEAFASTTGPDGVCVLEHGETDPNHASVPVVDDESGIRIESMTDDWRNNPETIDLFTETSNILKAKGIEFNDIKDVMVYDSSKCVGGSFWCRGEKSPTRKPEEGNGYECDKFEAKDNAVIASSFDFAWICRSDDGCQCGHQPCAKGNACIDEQCIAPKEPAECLERGGTFVDDKCLCNGQEFPIPQLIQ